MNAANHEFTRRMKRFLFGQIRMPPSSPGQKSCGLPPQLFPGEQTTSDNPQSFAAKPLTASSFRSSQGDPTRSPNSLCRSVDLLFRGKRFPGPSPSEPSFTLLHESNERDKDLVAPPYSEGLENWNSGDVEFWLPYEADPTAQSSWFMVENQMDDRFLSPSGCFPSIEEIQDSVVAAARGAPQG